MKFVLLFAVLFAIVGPPGCYDNATPDQEVEEVVFTEDQQRNPSSSQYFDRTLREAENFLKTEDPTVWMKAMQSE